MFRHALPLIAAVILLIPGGTWARGRGETRAHAFDTPSACLTCHSSTSPKYSLLGARVGYETSGHKTLGNASYANGDGCQVCHTNEGFIDFVSGRKVGTYNWVTHPSQPGCYTCHAPHEKGDMSLRTATPVKLITGRVFNSGQGNLCANCHRATDAAANLVVPTPADKVTISWGVHNGPQADIVNGSNAYEFPGKVYGSSTHKDVIIDGCVDCHMRLPAGRSSFSSDVGGHSFKLSGVVHGELVLNTTGCVSCHRDVRQIPDRDVFNVMAKEDYDRNGKKEPIEDEVQGLLNRLVSRTGTGLLQKGSLPVYKPDGSLNITGSTTVRPVLEMAALYNYKMIAEDRSRGIHNAKYVIQILCDSIQALDPSFNVSRRPR